MDWIVTIATVLAFIIVGFILLIFMPKPKVFFDPYVNEIKNFAPEHDRIKKEIEDKEYISKDDYFYFSDLCSSDIFNIIETLVDEKHIQKAFDTLLSTIYTITSYAKSDTKNGFKKEDNVGLFDIDLFTSKLGDIKFYNSSAEVSSICILIVSLAQKIQCKNLEEIKSYSRILWKIVLVIYTNKYELYKKELQEMYTEVFKDVRYYAISGAEYETSLQRTFSFMDDVFKTNYITKCIEYFETQIQKNPDQAWHKSYLHKIMSVIHKELDKVTKTKVETITGDSIDVNFTPTPSILKGESGMVSHKSPEAISSYSVIDIISKLQNAWSPKKLNEMYKDDNFLSPRGAEGLGDEIKSNFKLRKHEYFDNIQGFFNIDKIHPHYLASLLRSVKESMLDADTSIENIEKVLGLFTVIKNTSGIDLTRVNGNTDWLSDWIEVHRVITDVMTSILETTPIMNKVFKKKRPDILAILKYLLSIKESPEENEKENLKQNDPYHIAINSIRGKAYRAFINFVIMDGKDLKDDVKKVFELTLEDKSYAIRFVIGYYLAILYYRDIKYVESKFPQIFSLEETDMFLVAMEGYMSNSLYEELFDKMKSNYTHFLSIDTSVYTKRAYYKDINELCAIHFALAFIHFDFNKGNELFDKFFVRQNEKAHSEFISLIGKNYFYQDNLEQKWLENNIGKCVSFWNDVLSKKIKVDIKSTAFFSFWINPKKEYIPDKDLVVLVQKTLTENGGDWSFDIGLRARLQVFSEINPKNTLDIVESFLLSSNNECLNKNRSYPIFSVDREIKSALVTIYKNKEFQPRIKKTVNLLVEFGGQSYWGLKDVLDKDIV
jgi:hypothetical protein